jgi:hypothetical protein
MVRLSMTRMTPRRWRDPAGTPRTAVLCMSVPQVAAAKRGTRAASRNPKRCLGFLISPTWPDTTITRLQRARSRRRVRDARGAPLLPRMRSAVAGDRQVVAASAWSWANSSEGDSAMASSGCNSQRHTAARARREAVSTCPTPSRPVPARAAGCESQPQTPRFVRATPTRSRRDVDVMPSTHRGRTHTIIAWSRGIQGDREPAILRAERPTCGTSSTGATTCCAGTSMRR